MTSELQAFWEQFKKDYWETIMLLTEYDENGEEQKQ